MSNPVDEYLTEKKAFFGKTVGDVATGAREAFSAKGLGTLGAQALAVAGVGMLLDSTRQTYMAATKNQHFKKMLEVNPDLGEAQQQDPKMFNQYYNSLRKLNPQFAADPVVAGSYMRKMTEFPTNAGSVLVDSLRARPADSGFKDFNTGLGIARSASESEQMKRHMEQVQYERMLQEADGG